MTTAKNIFENAAETQKKVLDTFMETSKSFGDFTKTKAYETAPDFYKNWLNSQMDFAKSFAINNEASKNGDHSANKNEHFNDFYKELYSNQMNFFKNAFENAQNGNKSFDFMKSNGNKKPMMSNPMMNNMNFSNFMPNNPWNMNNAFNTSALTDNATKMYNSMSSNFTKNIEMLQDMFLNSITKDSFKNLNHNMEAYTRMYEIWLPVYKSLQNKMFDMESLKQMANPAQFKSVMDKVFDFSSAEHIQNFTNMLNGSVNYSQEHLQANMNEMMELNQKNMALLAKIMSGDFNAISEYNNNIIAYANKQQNPLAKLFPQMNENDYSQKMQSLVTDLNKYSSTISQLQYKMYVTGQNTLENLIKEVAELAQEGKDVSNYNEFYQKWIEVSGKAYIEFFKTDEFSALQGEVINLGLRLKLDIEAATEKMFEGLPIAKKSDLDELYKTIADLKRRLRTVEKNDSEVVSEETKSTKKAKA